MQKPYFLPERVNVQLQRPRCATCDTHMMLARITPARVGFHLRTSECAVRDQAHEVLVANEAFDMSSFSPLATAYR